MELEHEVKATVINHCSSYDPMLGQSVEMLLKTMPFENIAKFVDILKPILTGYSAESSTPSCSGVKPNTNRPHTADRLFGHGSDIPFRGQRWVPHPLRTSRNRRRFSRSGRRAARARPYHSDYEPKHRAGPDGNTPPTYNLRGATININGSLIVGQQDENYSSNSRFSSFSQQLDTNFEFVYEHWVRR
ncbi:uncharacterized protein LOC141852775 isoform X2 [Brevipalpus obovatus]|uniref:uncharacterized protein LOC141852775 isoform X2 n=1 Tax=Brevipalpus obovatus TaxID=246614 RepID=UPI003D9F283A